MRRRYLLNPDTIQLALDRNHLTHLRFSDHLPPDHGQVHHRIGSMAPVDGYDPDSRLFVAASLALRAAVAELTAPPQPQDALQFLLREVLGDFPFARESDRAHAVAALLLPVVRHLVDGPTPLHLIEAPTPGTGKTLLADVIHVVATGEPVEPTPLPRREEEVRKKITSVLLGSPALVLLDNINHGIDSPSLAAALTKDRWSDRVLGQSRMVRLPNRAMWLATANNPVLSHEMSRRSVRIRLDADAERPWLRDGFRHADLVGWVRAHRGEVIVALLELARGWLLAGAPEVGGKLGSYAAWARVIGGVLGHAGVDGFLDDRQHDEEAEDPVEAEWRALVALWFERFGTDAVEAKALQQVAAGAGLLDLDDGPVGEGPVLAWPVSEAGPDLRRHAHRRGSRQPPEGQPVRPRPGLDWVGLGDHPRAHAGRGDAVARCQRRRHRVVAGGCGWSRRRSWMTW